ncbi:hypothetical protein GOP47_0021137 [Adiantum capillus-veneris]|uniref:Pentatricopeptide repeat-containing protein n=1 Tax=Adiantum capillus-veneris TaxID=13818 RepID=A0A9D4UBB9_ADICA|nr:hypothetical protein GOP47_0021137 [Adiantum capillus-veneris]
MKAPSSWEATKGFLWIDGLYAPFWASRELRQGRLVRVKDEKEKVDVFVTLLRVCAKNKDLHKGATLHDQILRRGLLTDCLDALVTMYVQCGELSKAEDLFAAYKSRDIFTWTALIGGYAQKGQGEQALTCFEHMLHEGIFPDAVTFNCVLKACGSIRAVDKGERIHDDISKQGLLQKNVLLGNSLVNMYAKCGALARAEQVLEELPVRNAISWSSLISGYAEHGEGEQALDCYERMRHEGLLPDAVTFICLLKACGSIRAGEKGELIRDEIAKQGLVGTDIVLNNALVDMYVNCGALDKARQLLEELPMRDVVSWSTIISGYAQQGEGEQALKCLEQMEREGLHPNAVTFICILKACGSLGAACKGETFHDVISKQGLLGNDIVLSNALISMYAKCGALPKAARLLEGLPSRDVISWNAMMAGYIQKGEGEHAIACYEKMQSEGLSPDATTFLCVLTACSRLGFVEIAQRNFWKMIVVYGVKPGLEHYTCMVNLFGRVGHLQDAVEIIKRLPYSDSAVWSSLLGACQKWGDVSVGKWGFDRAIQVDKDDAAPYTLMASIYAAVGMQDDAGHIEAMRIKNKAWAKPQQPCWIEVF